MCSGSTKGRASLVIKAAEERERQRRRWQRQGWLRQRIRG